MKKIDSKDRRDFIEKLFLTTAGGSLILNSYAFAGKNSGSAAQLTTT
jgi:hypothetical protein